VRRFLRWFLVIVTSAAVSVAQAGGFSLTDVQGKRHTLDAYKGKWVLVNFWATWCPPCLEEIPDFVSLYDARKDKDLMVIGVAVDYQDRDQIVQFADKLPMSYPLVLGDADNVSQFGGVSVLPVSFLYDPKGKLALHRIGPLQKETLQKFLSQ
jgi:thiol-disulfide isomerase/thioredoxin